MFVRFELVNKLLCAEIDLSSLENSVAGMSIVGECKLIVCGT